MKQAKCLDFNVTKISYTIFKKKSAKYYWLNMLGLHYLLAEGDIGAPIYWRT